MPRPVETYQLSVLIRPARSLSPAACAALVEELRTVAAPCFGGEFPNYQALSGRPEELDRAVIGLARRSDGKLAGFCACLLIPVEGVGDVFHLGLTCVGPEDRSAGLTHRLLARTCTTYLLNTRPLGKIWFSNVACVLSSLGNVAMHFENVYPSPFRKDGPSESHLRIARAISKHYRAPIAIDEGAILDEQAFVMRGSVPGTVFEKSALDIQYHHRDAKLTRWYADRMDFHRGDEVVQIGQMSALGAIRHFVAKTLGWKPTFVAGLPAPVESGRREAAPNLVSAAK